VGAFLAHDLWPFALAAGLIVAVAASEGLALLVGASVSHWLDGAVADTGEPDGPASAALGWLHVGKVPIIALIVIFLTAFAVTGFLVQLAARGATGQFAALPIAVAVALVAAIVAVRLFGAALGRIIPQDETNAVPDASLVGRIGTIVIGVARAGKPAQARIRVEDGSTHYVMVEPEGSDEAFATGTAVLLVRHLSGRRFHAIRNPKPELL
jgi:hypothetical protein